MLRQKTAAYSFCLPLELAGILRGLDPEDVALLSGIGAEMGLVYQIRDDLLGTFGDPVRTGKSVVGDLREGKATLLVVAASGHPAWTERAQGFGDPELSEAGAQDLRNLLRETGALEAVEQELSERTAALVQRIQSAPVPRGLRQLLEDLVRYSVRRDA